MKVGEGDISNWTWKRLPADWRMELVELGQLRKNELRPGRRATFNTARLLRIFVELEARARVLTNGQISALLSDIRVRLVDQTGKRRSLNQQDRGRLRKQHQRGARELAHLQAMQLHYGNPGSVPRPLGSGRPHPRYFEVMRQLENLVSELTARSAQLIPTDL